MPRLPLLTSNEQIENIAVRINFLTAAASRALNPDDETLEGQPPDAADTWLEAADLAFAIDRTADALNMLAAAVGLLLRGDRNERYAAALPGAITRTVAVELIRAERPVRLRFGEGREFVEPEPPLTPLGAMQWTELLFAAAASGGQHDIFERFPDVDWVVPRVRSGDVLVPSLLAFSGDQRDSVFEVAHGSLVANAVQWTEDVRLQQLDEHHWLAGRFRTPLVDLRRVAFELALRRREDGPAFARWRSETFIAGLPGLAARFAIDLAADIDRRLRSVG